MGLNTTRGGSNRIGLSRDYVKHSLGTWTMVQHHRLRTELVAYRFSVYISPHGETKKGVALRDLVNIAKALSDTGRVRILLALKGRELCVSQLVGMLDLAPSTVSKHMAVLRQASLVEYRKDGPWAYYRRAGRDAAPQAKSALRWIDNSIANRRVAKNDERRLQKILDIPVEKLRGKMKRQG